MLDIKKLGKILVESKKGENKIVGELSELDFGYGSNTLIVHTQRLFDELLRLTDTNSTHLSRRELGEVFPSLSNIDISLVFNKLNNKSRKISFEEFLDFIIGLDEKTRVDIFGCFRNGNNIDEEIGDNEDIDINGEIDSDVVIDSNGDIDSDEEIDSDVVIDYNEDIDSDEVIDGERGNLVRRFWANLMEILGKIKNGLFIRCWVKR